MGASELEAEGTKRQATSPDCAAPVHEAPPPQEKKNRQLGQRCSMSSKVLNLNRWHSP